MSCVIKEIYNAFFHWLSNLSLVSSSCTYLFKAHVYDKKINACMYTEKISMTRGVFLWYITQKRFISNGFLSYSYCIFWDIGNIWWLYLSCKRTLSEKGPFVPSVAWQRKDMNWPTSVQRLGNRVSHCYINLLDKLIGLSALGPFEWRYFIKLYILSVFNFVSFSTLNICLLDFQGNLKTEWRTLTVR